MITVTTKGDYKKLSGHLEKLKHVAKLSTLDKYGRKGVQALSAATPKDSGETANSWSYSVIQNGEETRLVFNNSHINKGVNIAIILQLGHGTRRGGYVKGLDYINPSMRSVFNEMKNELWKEMTTV